MKKQGTRLLAAALAAVAVIAAASCSAKYNTSADYATQNSAGYSGSTGKPSYGYEYDMSEVMPEEGKFSFTSDSSGKPVDDTRKIIKTVSLSLETKNFDAAISEIVSVTAAAGGYVEDSYVSGKSLNDYGTVLRYATYTLRVPAAGLDAYVNTLSGGFNVLSRQESSTDITDSYYDSKSRLDSLLVQEERLLSMLEGATDLEYMLKLEDKLSEVRYQIESIHSTLQRYDKSVEMATVSVHLQEVVEYQRIVEAPKSFGERLYQSFTESWADFAKGVQNFLVDFVYAIPTLMVLAVFICIAVLIVSRLVKRHKKNKAEAAITDSEKKE